MTGSHYPAAHIEARERVLSEAIQAGKFPESRRPRYEALLDVNFDYGSRLIEAMAASPILANRPVTQQPPQGYDQNWLSPAERARLGASKNGTTPPQVIYAPGD